LIVFDDRFNTNKRFWLFINRRHNGPIIQSTGVVAMKKTMSFATVHFTVAFSVGWLISGDVLVGGAIALVEPAVNTVAYYFHERAWSRMPVTPGRVEADSALTA
jgi:uncharacterized membrane protein